MMPGPALFLVSTPLGNLQDLSPRGADVLRTADVLYAEDTRSAARLLSELGIARKAASCFDANEAQRARELAAHFEAGRSVALFSEAGTPAVSDPGYRMVQAAIEAGVRVIPVPGPSAVLAALVASGLATDRFYFGGFLPRKTQARREAISEVKALAATLIFFESPLRTGESLRDLHDVLGDRAATVARELTKTHEDFVRGSLRQLAETYAQERPLGEITLVVAGAGTTTQTSGEGRDAETLQGKAEALLAAGLSARDAATRLAFEVGLSRREAYGIVLALAEKRRP